MIREQQQRPLCDMCKQVPARPNGTSVRGYQRWHSLCSPCAKKKYRKIDKDDRCNCCGFVAEHSSQLCWVDEETLCLNCNALRLLGKKRRAELSVDATVDWGNIRL